ncbi:MAG: hypothetical protein ACYC5H_10265 [Methylovirgula sp.]
MPDADSDDVARLKRDNAAQGFLDDVAHHNGMMPPWSRASLADIFCHRRWCWVKPLLVALRGAGADFRQ